MSRFEDTLQRDLHVIADRATPSPDAWAQIQSRIDDQEPFQETEIIMLTENTLTRRRWPLVAAAAAVAALAIGAIALVNRGDGVDQPADVPPPTVAPAPVVEPEVVEPEAEAADSDVAELPSIDQPVGPGTYTTDALGVPLTFDVPEGTGGPFTREVTPTGAIQLAVRDGILEVISIGRIGSFYGSAEASEGTTLGLGSIAADDIDGWIENNDITMDQESDVTVGGRPAKLRQVRFDNKHPNGFWGFSGSADVAPIKPQGFYGDSDNVYPIWLISMDEFEPLFIWAVSHLPDQQQWIDDIAMPLVASIQLGEPGPAIEGGTARVPQRVDVFASYSGTRAVGPVLDDGTAEVVSANTVEGDLVGEITGIGVQVTPANGYDDLTFTGAVDGLGTGTLTMRQEWTGSPSGDIATTTVVTGGTGDLAGISGRVITSVEALDESGDVPIYSGRMTLQLVVPRSG